MTIDERLEALTMNLELASRDIQDIAHNLELASRGIQDLTLNLKLATSDIQDRKEEIQHLRELARQDGENIRGLARIADIHERRLTRLEGGDIEDQPSAG